jgi:KUP system potassium uptake protein
MSFFVANISKFHHGGWITLLIAAILTSIMIVWFEAKKIIKGYVEFCKLNDYLGLIKDVSNDNGIEKYSTHLVYLTSANKPDEVEQKIIYSILQKRPKRADLYWFLHVNVVDEPYCTEYKVTQIDEKKIIRIDFRLGFRVIPRINLMFRQVVQELTKNKEVDILSRYKSLNKQNVIGDFRFVVMKKFLSYENELPTFDQLIMNGYFFLKRFSLSEEAAFSLDTSNVRIEKIPLVINPANDLNIKRILHENN